MKSKKLIPALMLAMSITPGLHASNTVTEVKQVTSTITLSDDVDYVITSTAPFGDAGSVNITNTEHAVVILRGIKPSKVISSYLKNHIYIEGKPAVNGSNCQVKMYGYGAIIMPYASSIKPLTVYSEPDFGGTSVNDFGLENSGGFMNTLTDAKLNNKIRSFKLKRGYMVTFSTRKEGRGYSRCFIADKEDLEVASLPGILDQSISSYRVFQWYNAKKAGIASDTRAEAVDATNSSWCYSWGLGESRLPDAECVPNHIYEDWPSPAACGGVTYSCHMKTNNEPGNASDDHPQDVATVLANWQNLMRTGMRLCSESSHDGSMAHLKAFIDSIDARGWRCDLLDLHCYWNSGSFNNLNWYSDYYGNGRPIWISEWVWGSSWNRAGFWAQSSEPGSTSTENQTLCYNGTKPILETINANSRVERYAYWNSEAAGTHIYDNGKLTKLGEYYASMGEGLGYNPDNEFIPKCPPQFNPSNLAAQFDKEKLQVELSWHDKNGEYNESMTVQCRVSNNTGWSTVATIPLQEEESDYTTTVEGRIGYKYRVCIVDANGTTRYTNEAQAVSEEAEAGDVMEVDGQTFYMGGNMLVNGDFSLGLTDWTNGAGELLTYPYFEAVPRGGSDGGAYLQTYGNGDKTSAQTVRKLLTLSSNGYYFAQAAGCNGAGKNQTLATSTSLNFSINTRVNIPAVTDWSKQGNAFHVTKDSIMHICFQGCEGKAQFDEVIVARLFATQDSALQDALYWAQQRAAAFVAYNTAYPQLNNELTDLAASATSYGQLKAGIDAALLALQNLPTLDLLRQQAETAISCQPQNVDAFLAARDAALQATSAQAINEAHETLSALLDAFFPFVVSTTGISNASFAGTSGWDLKTGSYTGGDQRKNTVVGKTCWNAWWSTPASGGSDTNMAIQQTITKPAHGFYALEAKAATEHYCVSDQHATLTVGGESVASPALSAGLLDLPNMSDAEKWETLVTPYLYASEKDTLTIGFIGSKQGAIDNAYMPYGNPTGTGDQREGWWCATDFAFRFVPAFQTEVNACGWGTICLPYEIEQPQGLTFYEIVGITADSTKICIQQASEMAAGTPYIYRTDATSVIFLEKGTKVTSAKTNVNGLRGMFVTASQYPVGSLALEDGEWHYIPDAASRYPIASYSGFIYKLANLAVLDAWDGLSMPTVGLAHPTAIESVWSDAEATDKPAYTPSGTRTQGNAKGLVIRNGKVIFNY